MTGCGGNPMLSGGKKHKRRTHKKSKYGKNAVRNP